ncbi:hypothetical protein [Flavobacterium sp.]|uniref:hypothetical protein n=1 Tax=Flavobacterium sp. TaxID=239 RepID=UPI0038FC4100
MKSIILVHQKNNLDLVSKTIIKFIIVLLLVVQNSFAISKPIPGVGIVVKKNPGTGSITVPTGNGGGFSTQLSEGIYELSFPQDQLQTSINGIVKTNYPKSSYQYDGSGVEFVLDNSQIKVNSQSSDGNRFTVDKQTNITIIVPKGGATLSGKLSWNDAVMTNSKICPEGFTMQNGECIPNNISGNEQARTESTPIRGISVKGGHNPKPTMMVSLNANGGTSSSKGVDTGFSFNPSLGIAIHWKNFGIGLDAGTFSTKPNFDFNAYAAPLQNLDYLTITNTKNNYTSTYFMLGPQYTVNLSGRHTPFHNKLTFTVALKGGLTINKTPEFSVIDNSTPPKNVASYEAPQDYKKNAFSLKPSISFAYWISKSIALTANAQYLMQTGQEEFTTAYRDLSAVNFSNADMTQQQINAAPKVVSTTKGPDKFMSFGFGITYNFNKGGGDCDDSRDITSNETQRKGIQENGLKKNDVETASNETQRKGIQENGLKKNDVDSASENRGIDKADIRKNDVETVTNEAEVKQIAETLVNLRKGWDGSVKGNKAENIANEADVKMIAETLVNLARKGWDGSIKGNKIESVANEADVKSIAETLVNIRKGWDGSIKGNKAKNIANEADVKMIAEALVNLRKGWDGSIKGYVPETGYGEIKPWLAKDGSIVYFEYEEDFLVEDQRMCDALGVKSFTIKKGKYKVNYDNSTTGGKLIWTLRKPINLKNNSNIETKIFHTTGGKHKHCSAPSNCCVATISSFSINDNLQPFYFKPIVINGNCSTIELQFIDVNTPRPSSE